MKHNLATKDNHEKIGAKKGEERWQVWILNGMKKNRKQIPRLKSRAKKTGKKRIWRMLDSFSFEKKPDVLYVKDLLFVVC